MTPAWTWPTFHNLDELVKTINVFKKKKESEPTTLRRSYGIPVGGCNGGAEVIGRRTVDMVAVCDMIAQLVIVWSPLILGDPASGEALGDM